MVAFVGRHRYTVLNHYGDCAGLPIRRFRLLKAAGSSLKKVVKPPLYLTDLADCAAMNAVYSRYFPTGPRPRTSVQVSALALGVHIEIEAVASA